MVGVELAGVSMAYTARGRVVRALEQIDLCFAPGSFVAIVGPSGCGKSTLLRLAGGLNVPSQGTVHVDGMPVEEARRRRQFGYAFQEPLLLPWLDTLGNTRLLSALAGTPSRRDEVGLLRAVGLAEFGSHYPAELSGGMQQRVALARALSLAPRYLLLDEPFAAVDDLSREALDDLLGALWAAERFACVLVTHHIAEAVYLADEVIVLSARPGRIRAHLPIDLPRPRTAEVRSSAGFARLVGEVRSALR